MQILLTIAYDGTNYSGWQKQDNAITVQEKVEDALSQLLNRVVVVQASSRTDAGVHALGQRASFFAEDLRVPLDKLPMVLVGLLPSDISVIAAKVVPDDFNPRFCTEYKTYAYNIYNAPSPNPLLNRYSAFIPQCLNIEAMKEAAQAFVGQYDFAAFCATGGSAKTTVRKIFSCTVEKQINGLVTITVTGNGFLYNMVRIIAGTIAYVGMGKILPQDIKSIIMSVDRTQAGKTMPPQGLVLIEVGYPIYWTNHP
ncbi:MAG: tRNA pseudouridine(38-40) synthase TruA [Defluviitaleaceae bacterium]|nr:tRNA pseudouridine(38-40) synthase TruA [Defluviitaleaceae bacterium]